MAKTVADVMNMVKENEVKFVDFRFTDTRGKEQHVSVPVSHFDEDKFTSGHAFDGSSIAGWKGIEASDMLLMPDPNTANIDPFFEEPTLILSCDVVDPADGKAYERDPRSLAKRAEAYLKASGLGDTAYFGPEPEFFIFDSVRWGNEMSGSFFKIESEEGAWNSSKEYEHGNSGYRPTVKGGYFPVPPVDSGQDMRSEMCLILEQMGIPVEVHHHEVANAGSACARARGTADASEPHVGRQLFLPSVDRRLECMAVFAAIGEELEHLDLPRVKSGLARRHGNVVLAFDRTLLRGNECGRGGQRDGGDSGELSAVHGERWKSRSLGILEHEVATESSAAQVRFDRGTA